MIEGAFALAFTAGLVSTLNPCGFAMLPAYMSYFMGLDAEESVDRTAAVRQGLVVGGVVSAGFVLVFAIVGVPITLGLRSLIDVVPWAAIAIGLAIAGLGVWMLLGHELRVRLPGLERAGDDRSLGSSFLFGISYAIASLSCTLPVFLTVVAGAIPRTNVLSGFLMFVVYGLGMSLTLVAVTLLLAFGKSAMLRRLRRSARHVNRVAGGILVVAGIYIVWFWATNLQDPLTASGPVALVERFSSRATEFVGDRPWVSAGVSAAVIALAGGLVATRSQDRDRPTQT